MKSATVRTYAPEMWGSLEKFGKFYAGTFALSKTGKRAVSGAINHFHKAVTLHDLAIKLTPNLADDEKELYEKGYSSAINSKELSAVIEAVILELYSSVDCTRKVVTEIYSTQYRRVPDSTRRYFQRIRENKIDPEFPEQLVIAVQEATWYDRLRQLRDELTHHDTGSCHKNSDSNKVNYMHQGISIEGRPLIIDDIFEHLRTIFNDVNQFTGRVFAYLYTQLNDEPVMQVCGFFGGRCYTRMVKPSEAIDFHGGTCEAYKWFELEDNPTCIFAAECDAYKRLK